ncbi:MAG: tetratricopeptide repeat protein, partial [Acidobacteriaceae bacterium]
MRVGLVSLVLLLCATMFGQDASPDQLLSRAIEEQQKGDFAAAIRDYRALLAMRPETLAARVNLGAALAHTGQLDAAIAQYQAALKLAPQLGSVHLDLGLAYSRKGDLPDALDQYEAAHRADPRNVRVAILLGDAQARSGKAADAIAMLTPLETDNAANPDFEYALGEALIRGGHPRDGAARVEKSAAMTNAADSWMLAGSTLLDLNEFAQARRDLDNAMRLDPSL